MPRAIWSGSISFGLIYIPVKLYSAVSEKSVRFNQIDRRNGARIRQRKVNAETGEEVPAEDIVKGFELAKGSYVLMSEADLATIAPEGNGMMDLDCFVELDDIDPIYFDGAYHVMPEKAAKPYALLVRAMEESRKVAIARFVMRSKQYIAVMRPKDGALLMSMLVYEDEINPAADLDELADLAKVTIDDRELAMAGQLVESLTQDWNPERYHDEYRERVLDLIDQKAAGKELVTELPAGPDASKVVDLIAALEASVAAAKASRVRHPTAADADNDAGPDNADNDDDADNDAGADNADNDDAAGPAARSRRRAVKKSA